MVKPFKIFIVKKALITLDFWSLCQVILTILKTPHKQSLELTANRQAGNLQ
jgi:hypothetical protein